MALPIALQLYSVRYALNADFEGTIRKVKELGYDGVEFAGLFDKKPEYIKALLDETGLVPISAHVDINTMLNDPEGTFAAYRKIGCKYIAVPYLPVERRPGSGIFEKTLEDIKMLGKKAKEAGLILLYHNHDFEFVKIGDEYALDILYKTVPSDLLQTEFDTCWIKVSNEDPAEYITKYKGRTPVVHLKDFYKPADKKAGKMYELIGISSEGKTAADEEVFGFRPLGYGMQDIPAILKASIKSGAEWVVVEQDSPQKGKTEMESARLSIKYLKNLKW
jgi:sugar phosphate isomerase/epimerase